MTIVTYELTGQLCLQCTNSKPDMFLDITGYIKMENKMTLGVLGYIAEIESFELRYGGLSINGNYGSLRSSNDDGHTYLILSNVIKEINPNNLYDEKFDFQVLELTKNTPLSFTETEREIPTPTQWTVDPAGNMNDKLLVPFLHKTVLYSMTNLTATFNPDYVRPSPPNPPVLS